MSARISQQKLFQKSRQWGETIEKVYPPEQTQDAFDVLALFILNRFRKLTLEEVTQMLHFDLAETVAGQELIQIGEKKVILKLLKMKFQSVPRWVSKKLEQLTPREYSLITKRILGAGSLEEVFEGL